MVHLTQQWLLFLGSLTGAIGVAFGAFGAHVLKDRLDSEMLAIFEIGVRYQMYHALAIISASLAAGSFGSFAVVAGWIFFAGILIFSGSLYALAFTSIRTWGVVTPVGGVLLLAGWIFFAVSAFYKA